MNAGAVDCAAARSWNGSRSGGLLSMARVEGRINGWRLRLRAVPATIMLPNFRSDRALESAHRAFDRLMGVSGLALHDDSIQAHQPGLEGAMDLTGTRLRLAVRIGQMRLDPRDPFAEATHRAIHHSFEVFGHELAAVGVQVGVEQDVHGIFRYHASGRMAGAWGG